MSWQFKREEQTYPQVPVGEHRIRVKSAEKAISSKGNDMIILQFDVSGSNLTLYHYITFLNDRPEITNRMLTAFFDSFKDISEGDFNMNNWIGKVGACVVAVDKNDESRTRLSYFIKAGDRQDKLPAWKEPDGSYGSGSVDTGFGDLDMDLPFE